MDSKKYVGMDVHQATISVRRTGSIQNVARSSFIACFPKTQTTSSPPRKTHGGRDRVAQPIRVDRFGFLRARWRGLVWESAFVPPGIYWRKKTKKNWKPYIVQSAIAGIASGITRTAAVSTAVAMTIGIRGEGKYRLARGQSVRKSMKSIF